MALVSAAAGLGYHYLFMEDDFALCPNGLQALAYLIRKAYMIHSNWFAIRTGYGLNGIILHGEDLEEMKVFCNWGYTLIYRVLIPLRAITFPDTRPDLLIT